jgi:RNA polymerase sigma-70 factor, ECF subfamily
MTNLTDEDLIFKTAKGDSKAFESLLGRYKNHVFGLCKRLMRSEMLAEEMSQETWIRVVRAAPQFEPKGSVKSWILTIAKNQCLNLIEKRGWEEAMPEGFEEQIADPTENLETILGNQAVKKQIIKAMDQLPDRQRAVLVLWMQDEKSYEEMAKDLKTHVGALKVLLHRAKENLARALREEGI